MLYKEIVLVINIITDDIPCIVFSRIATYISSKATNIGIHFLCLFSFRLAKHNTAIPPSIFPTAVYERKYKNPADAIIFESISVQSIPLFFLEYLPTQYIT